MKPFKEWFIERNNYWPMPADSHFPTGLTFLLDELSIYLSEMLPNDQR